MVTEVLAGWLRAVDEIQRRSNWRGEIWDRSPEERSSIVASVCEALEAAYGLPRFGNPVEPLDDLIYTVLTNKASPGVARRLFEQVKERFATWDEVLESPDTLPQLIQPGGLAVKKSAQIVATLRKVRSDFGACNLDPLKNRPEPEVEGYLVSLPGVSLKVAKCVMMYTLGAAVLPVDAHVHRVARRLGWTQRKRADQCHEEFEALVPRERRHAFHVDCIAHGLPNAA